MEGIMVRGEQREDEDVHAHLDEVQAVTSSGSTAGCSASVCW